MKTQIATGNFLVEVEGTLQPEKAEEIQANGVKYDLQRGGISSGWNAVGGVKGENGKVKLPKDFERASIEYSNDAALTMQGAVEDWAKGLFEGTANVTVTKYEGSETVSPMKRATTLVDTFLGTDMEANYRSVLGLPDGNRDELIAKANTLGLGLTAPKAAKS